MMKRTLSLLLCLIMVLSFAAPAVQASGTDDIYIAEGSSVSGLDNSSVAETEPDQPDATQPEQEDDAPIVQSSPIVDTGASEDPSQVTCDCGVDAALVGHSDGCALKQSCIALCAKGAMDIYNKWYTISADARDFVKEYLGQHYPDTLSTLEQLWAADQIVDENDSLAGEEAPVQHTGNASAQVGDITVDAYGIPEGSSLTVEDASKKAADAVEEVAADLGENPEQLFLYDISVQNDESDDWQPQGDSVYMTLTIPGVQLHKYATVYVVHVDDEGNATTINASVNEDGAIAFQTEGFSTFAGFTVDFKYGGAFFSIDGLTDIKLSALFDELQIPLYASDVVDLAFTDETLVSLTRLEEENDWLLTSLQAFKTQEWLTVTMNDGNVFEISVTDATAFIYVGGGGYGKGTKYDTDGNEFSGWYADKDGDLSTQNTSGLSGKPNDGWSNSSTIYISGSGTFNIGIMPYTNVTSNVTRAYVRLNQIRVGGNVCLNLYLHANFDSTDITEVRLQAEGTANMFIIEDGGSLKLTGRAPTSSKAACYLILDGWSEELNADNSSVTSNWGMNDYTKDNQLIQLTDGATGLICNYVRFQDAHRSAIRIANGENSDSNYRMKTFELSNCIFDRDVCRENTSNGTSVDKTTGSGGAIYLQDTASKMNGSEHYTWMDEIKLVNCQFNGCWAAESGGALGIYGRVRDITITNCSFTETYARRGYGGAITMAGHASTMKITGTTFDKCSSTVAGGAVYVMSRVLWSANNTYSRLNELTVTNCTFKNSGAIANNKTVNSPLGGGICLDSSINKITISGTTFNGTKAEDGGGISFGYSNMTKKTSGGEYNFMSNGNFTTKENALKSWRLSDSWMWRTTLGDISMSNCDFINTTATNQGGGIHFRSHSSARQAILDDVNFNGCQAVGEGSAVMLGDTIIPDLQYKNSIIQNCKTTANHSNSVGGTFRTIGTTTCAAALTNIQFLNNASHCSGGGLYWNASGVRELVEGTEIITAISVDKCTFDGNTAGWYGGGIYCEAVMTVSQCEVKNNVAVLKGGGIALQVYNNNVRMFGNDQFTDLTLDSSTKIHHNMSAVGGGISLRANATQAIDNTDAKHHTVRFQLGGAEVYSNYATEHGGGVFFNVETYSDDTNQQEVERFTKTIILDSGSVHDNTAAVNGGGIYMNGGNISDPDNTATSGLTANGVVSIEVTGAEVYNNEAGRTMTGVTTSGVDANGNVILPPTFNITKGSDGNIAFTKGSVSGGNGGGVYLEGKNALCLVSGGVIGALKNNDGTPGDAKKNIANANTDHTVGGNGGGIAIYGGARIEMSGGYVVNNTSDVAGGGIAVHDGSSMWFHTGGVVKDNQSHMGGGISLNGAKAPVENPTDDTPVEKLYGMYLDGGTVQGNIVTPDTTRANIAYGGGICLSAGSTMKLNGGLVTGNKATATTAGTSFTPNQEGGGIAVCQNSTMDIAGGTIKENMAYDGGGMVVRGGSTLNMYPVYKTDSSGEVVNDADGNPIVDSQGLIQSNAVTHYGGGIYSRASIVNISGGEINANTAYKGAGIRIDDRPEGMNSAIPNATIGGGVITGNTASSDGGGVMIQFYDAEYEPPFVEISGGEISSNTSGSSGGGIFIHGSGNAATKLNMYGGTVKSNTSSARGGGINADNYATVLVSSQTVNGKTTYPSVTENTGGRGGGIAVCYGSTLTVHEGFITYNKAVGSTSGDTAWHLCNSGYGYGGGVWVADGVNSTYPAKFTLSGSNMAIYGNTAEFAADDVFANGNNTQLVIPEVENMNLAGYNFAPEGWIEDYVTNDSKYVEAGLNMRANYAKNDPAAASNPILRYRNASATQRRYMLITPEYVNTRTDDKLYVNKFGAYVCMTLGIPAAVDDTIVVDYSNSVNINLWQNDLFMNTEDFAQGNGSVYGSYLQYSRPTDASYHDGVYHSAGNSPLGTGYDSLSKALSAVYNGKNGLITYVPKTMTRDVEDQFSYVVRHKGHWYYANVTVVPATTIYYEDNFAGVKYHTNSDVTYDQLATWTEVKGTDIVQDEDRPGTSLFEGLDADNIYGYDKNYASFSNYSSGSVHKVTVSLDGNTTTNARATFTFKGTGFDIISLSNASTGMVTVSVYKGSTGIVFEDNPNTPEWEPTDPVQTYMVDTYYQTGTDLYQVPIIKVSDLPYDTYTVEIYVAPGWIPGTPSYTGCDFYLDAIRIYDPAGTSFGTDNTIFNAYKDDNEQWPAYAELRNMFLKQTEIGETATNGVIFIDGQSKPTVADYKSWGPNNEIYLAAGQSVAFKLNASNYLASSDGEGNLNEQMITGIHLGMRGLTGTGSVTVADDAGHTLKKIDDASTKENEGLSATDMYYDISNMINNVVTITNSGSTSIAISNVKVTHKWEPVATMSLRRMFTVDTETADIALDILTPEELADPVVTPKYPALSFEGMVCYNVFFDAQDLGELTEADLGLAVFASEDTEGTVETAKDVIMGATKVDGLYMVATNGIHAKYLGDTQYFRAFAKLADGSYIYSKMVSYSALDYAKSVLAKSNDVKLKQLVVAMLNYGSEAQKFFGYKTDDLMNKDLTADDQALLVGLDAASLNTVGKVDASKVGSFVSNKGFSKRTPAISFKGAFEINYFFKPAYAVDGDMTLYVWNEDTYSSVSQLTAENADKAVVLSVEDGVYTGSSDEIIAKDLDKTVYVAAVYESDGVTYCSGVLPYSIAAYCQNPPADVQALATAAAVYGCTAKQFFGA